MATNDVPGANAANADVLAAGCWAEHKDGSLIYVKGTEQERVVYEIYDMAQDPPVFYQDAMRKADFEKQFSYKDANDIQWTWHDKTPFPWDRVMKSYEKPTPTHADVGDMMSAAARVADSLRLRAENITEEDLGHRVDRVRSKGASVLDRLSRAFEAFVE